MKPRYKLKSWVVICIYIIALGAVVSSLYLVGKTLMPMSLYDNLSYVYRGIINDDTPVASQKNDKIIKPYAGDTVKIAKSYYDISADTKIQESSLILYANTYMQNTGVLYTNDAAFDVLCVMDGVIEDIVIDETMGNVVTVKHSNNLVTVYQSLKEVTVKVGVNIKQGEVLGISGPNKIKTDSENMLLFEVLHNGVNINPELFYEMDIKELS